MRIKKKRKEVSNSVAGFPYLQERIMKKNMYITILQGMAVTAAFLITEIVLNWLGAFDGAVRLYLVDISLRLIFGTIALVLLADNFKKQRNEYSVKALFTNMISKRTYILLVPFLLYLIITMLTVITGEGKELSFEFAGLYSLNCVQQLAVGYYEEGTRALIMCGLLKYCIDTKKNRLQTIFVSGICFGLAHALNFFFGQDIVSTLWQVFHCFVWGLFIAAIYMLSKNLTLIMVMHAVWDIAIRVPKSFCILPENSVLLDGMNVLLTIIDYGILPALAVYICINYDKLRGCFNSSI